MCIRDSFSIDNKQREKHSATLDTELLARVYIELIDAREPSLNLDTQKKTEIAKSKFDIAKLKDRSLPIRLTDEERIKHKNFIKTLGEKAIWKKINI